MDIDDSSEKIRRNLLIFSFAIVVSWFLNLSIQKQAKIFSAIELTSISPFKFWLVITVILIYLFYRYWFDAATTTSISTFKGEVSSNRYKFIKRSLEKDIVKALINDKAPKFVHNYKELEDSIIVENNKLYGKPISVILHYAPQPNESPWMGTVGAMFTIKWTKTSYTKEENPNYVFVIPVGEKYFLISKTIFNMIFYSKSISELFVPVAFLFGALSICIYQLTNTYFHYLTPNLCWI